MQTEIQSDSRVEFEEEFFVNDHNHNSNIGKVLVSPNNSLAFLKDSSDTSNSNFSNGAGTETNNANKNGERSWVGRAFIKIFNINLFSISSCVPSSQYTSSTTYQFEKITTTKSPYDHFNGSFPYVITILGAPKVGKTMICKTLKSMHTDIHQRNLFKFSPMPPDVQISIHDTEEKEGQLPKQIDIGIYDTIGFHDADLIHYILEGQAIEDKQNLEKFESDEFTNEKDKLNSSPTTAARQQDKKIKKKRK